MIHVIIFRFVPVPITPLMVVRTIEGEGLNHQWVSIDDMSPHLARAAIASEDNRFCEHSGVDWSAVRTVFDEYREEGRLRGASTISMQTVKNLYFLPGRSVIRKGLEVAIVPLLEAVWPKKRIIEVYLNIAEMGAGIYGVEAASRHYWGESAKQLNAKQSAALASILPAPRRRNPTVRNRFMRQRAAKIENTQSQLGPLLGCVPPVSQRRSIGPKGPVSKAASAIPVHVGDPAAVPVPIPLELEETKGEDEATPEKPRRSKRKKVRTKRRRRSR